MTTASPPASDSRRPTEPPDRRRGRRTARWGALALAAAALVVVNALVVYSLALDRARVIDAAVDALDGESGVYESYVRRAVSGLDETMLALGDRLRAGAAPADLRPTAAALIGRSPLAEAITLYAGGRSASAGPPVVCTPGAAGLSLRFTPAAAPEAGGATPPETSGRGPAVAGRLELCRGFGETGAAVGAAFSLDRLAQAVTTLKENWSSTVEAVLIDGGAARGGGRSLFIAPPTGGAAAAPVGDLHYGEGAGLTARAFSAADAEGRLWLISEHLVTGRPLAIRVYAPLDRALNDWRRQATAVGLSAAAASLFLAACAAALSLQAAARERLMTRLAESEAEAMAIFDRTFHMILLLDLDGRIRRLNDVTRQAFGVTDEEVVGKRIWETVWADMVTDRAHAEQRLRVALDMAVDGGVARYETRVRRRDDEMEYIIFDVVVRPVTGAGGAVREVLLEARDVTETTRARESLLRSERLAALGGLVAGIAHEVNTPVGVATTSASYLVREVEELRLLVNDRRLTASRMQDFLNNAEEAARLTLSNCDRAAQIINSFKQVAVDQVGGERRRFQLAEYIDEVLISLRPRLRREPHKVETDCPADLIVETDPGALSHGLTNLVVNSLVHAFAPGVVGVIRISARLIEGDMVRLTYSDNGCGIPPELQEQVFDPFFTTRRGAGGSGLGLHILHNAATGALCGGLRLVSEPGRGATFILTFPRVLRAPDDAALRSGETAAPVNPFKRSIGDNGAATGEGVG